MMVCLQFKPSCGLFDPIAGAVCCSLHRSGAPMSQPAHIRSGHFTRRFSPAFCLLLLAALASAGCRATWRTSAGTRAFGQSTAATPPRGQSAVDARVQADKLDEYIEAEMRRQHIPGLSLGVVQGGKVVKIKAYGLANIELNVPATPSTVYQLQSITKSFVACGIMLLVEDGKIGLDDKITNYLSGLPQAWSGMTVRHLLAHTSGIRTSSATRVRARRLSRFPKSEQFRGDHRMGGGAPAEVCARRGVAL